LGEYKIEEYIAGSDYGRFSGKYILKEISWGQDNKISNVCTERIIGDKPIIRFNYEKYNLMLLKESLVEAPFAINEEEIMKIPKSLGEHLFLIATKLNTVSPEDQRTFLQTLEAASSAMKLVVDS